MSVLDKAVFLSPQALRRPKARNGIYFTFDDSKGPTHQTSLTVINGGYEKHIADFKLARCSITYYVIEFPVKGRCRLKINDSEYILEKGVIAGYQAGDRPCYLCGPDEPFEHYYINFSGDEAEVFFRNTKIKYNHILKLSEFEHCRMLMNSILKAALSKGANSLELCNSYLRTFLLELSNQQQPTKNAVSTAAFNYKQCLKYMDEHYLEINSLCDAAHSLNICAGYISRLFRRFGNTGAYRYITSLKMNKASELLLTSELSIGHIADLVGYEDQFHFSKVFKHFYGISPAFYRRQYCK